MRPVHPNLLARLRRGDSAFRYALEAHAVTRASIKQTKADWQAGDGPPSGSDFEFVADGGLRLAPTISALISSTTGSSNFTDLNNDYPYTVAHVSWKGTEDPNVEIMRVKANLHPNRDGSGRQVVWWRCRLFACTSLRAAGGYSIPTVAPLGDPIDVRAAGDAAGDVTFDFSTLTVRPKPKSVIPRNVLALAAYPDYANASTFVFIYGLKADGSAAGNVGWGYDNTITVFGSGNELRGKTFDKQGAVGFPLAQAGEYIDLGLAAGVPKLTIETGSFTQKTITFSSGNLLDLGASPTGSVYLSALANTPSGSSVTFRIRNDADSAYVDFTDGQTFADLGLTATQTRKCQMVLTPNAAGNVTPTVRRIGMEEKAIVDLSRVAEVTSYRSHVDPITLEGQPTQATIRAVKNGVANYRSTIEDLLTTYDIGSIEFRWYAIPKTGAPRSEWMLIDSFPVIDDFEPDAAAIGIDVFGANALVSSALPKYDSSGSGLETPDSTVTNPGSWTDQAGGSTNIHLTIDEDPADDTDYVASPSNPSNAAVEFGLSNLADPNRDTGHFVDIRFKKDSTGGQNVTLTVELRQGAVVKMTSDVMNVPDEWTDVSIALSAAAAQSISDYTDLRVRLIANGGVGTARKCYVSWVQFRVTGQRVALTYTNQAANTTYADLLNQAEVPARFIGQGLSSTQTVSKTITNSNALAEARYLAAVFGSSIISTRGAIWTVDMFSAQGIAAEFPADRIQPIRIVPGFRERRWLVTVPWNWNYDKNRFDDEAIWASSVAKTKLGVGRIDAEEKWNEESGKWIYSSALAKTIAIRTGQALSTGLILWRFRAQDQWPEIECGDRAAIGTTRFLGKDPNSTRPLRGKLVGLATITDCTYTNGFWEFTGWLTQGYADILAQGGTNYTVSSGPTIIHGEPVFRGDHLYALWIGDPKVNSVKVATSTTSQPAAGTGTAVNGQSGEYDTGAATYGVTTYITITPYSQTGGTGIAGNPFYTKYRLPHIETLIDTTTGKPLRSTAWNDQGAFLSFVSPSPGTFFSYASGGPASGQMWISFDWSSATLYRPDATTATVPAPPAAPSAPTLSQVAGGALGARTRWARIAYLKTDPFTGHETLYPVSAESSFAISANNLLKVTALADPGNGLYDGWAVLVGSASNTEYVQGATAKQTFGVDWTEPAGGFSTTQNSLWTTSWKKLTKIGLDPTTTYKHYPYYHIALDFVFIPAETTNASPQLASLQNGDGVLSLGRYGSAAGYSGVIDIATPAAASTGSGNVGGGRLT